MLENMAADVLDLQKFPSESSIQTKTDMSMRVAFESSGTSMLYGTLLDTHARLHDGAYIQDFYILRPSYSISITLSQPLCPSHTIPRSNHMPQFLTIIPTNSTTSQSRSRLIYGL